MKKLLTLICWMILPAASLLAQEQEEKLYLESSSHSRIDGTTGHMVNYVPLYRHKGSTLRADSGYVYTDSLEREYFDAFGNVVITQPNGTMIFANKLHYAGETQLAVLTGNVRMVDDNTVLTTNYLTYNMKSDIGTYTNGGRITNETDTITSDRAWYFNNTKDAYFRLDVIVRTRDVQIFTDTMRYNSESKTTFFYGPTNIKGKKGENLYTEEGYYNTETELAEFYKNNLYTEHSRLLRGDTLYYDGKSGNGRALSNVLFIDTADQFFVEGMVGLYDQQDESILMTERALVTMVVDKEDSGPPDSLVTDSLVTDSLVTDSLVTDSLVVMDSLARDSLVVTDSLVTDRLVVTDSLARDSLVTDRLSQMGLLDPDPPASVDSVYLTADTLYSKMIFLRDYVPLEFNLDREGGEIDETDLDLDGPGDDPGGLIDLGAIGGLGELGISRDSLHVDSVQTDSVQTDSIRTDSIRTDSVQIDSLIREPLTDSTAVDSIITETVSDTIKTIKPEQKVEYEDIIRLDLEADSALRREALIPQGGEVDSLLMQAALALSKPQPADSIPTDSLANDTARTRIVKAYRNVRLFKSDLQAVADSAYYGYADSMMRFFGSPMAWAQGSQFSGDSLFLQIKKEKIDNIVIMRNAFIANTKQDSSKYNQIKGRKITGFFTNSELDRVFVDGNAENIVYRENDEGTGYTDMYHSRSARIKILVKDNELTDFIPIKSTEGTIYPLALVSQEQEILEGFIWKPGDRPRSKEDLLSRKRVIEQEVIQPEEGADGEGLRRADEVDIEGFETEGSGNEEIVLDAVARIAAAEAEAEAATMEIEKAEFINVEAKGLDRNDQRLMKLPLRDYERELRLR